MNDFEGSVLNDETDVVEETTDETSENINNQETESDNSEQKTEESGEETKLTDKGTKLDPNPQSAVHQELANYKREVETYRDFMNNPDALKIYVKELEGEVARTTGQSVEEIRGSSEESFVTDPDKIETAEDLRSYAKYLGKTVEKTKKDFLQEIERNKLVSREKAINDNLVSEISSIQAKYPELRAENADGTPNPEFDPVLEKEIADLYESLDFDKRSGKYMGRVSITDIANRFMKIRGTGESAGSKKAQTIVLDKRSGAVKTSSGSSSSPDESKLSAQQLIAARIQKAMRGR